MTTNIKCKIKNFDNNNNALQKLYYCSNMEMKVQLLCDVLCRRNTLGLMFLHIYMSCHVSCGGKNAADLISENIRTRDA